MHYLNLKNFEQNDNLNYTDIFKGIPDNIIACINQNNAPDLYDLIDKLKNSYFDCSDDWFIRNNIFDYTYITLKVKGIGINKIFYAKELEQYCSRFKPPDEVIINNVKEKYVHYEYDFKQEENEVILIWYKNPNYIRCGFYNCENITFADLSHFNSSNIKYISNLFDGCKSLKYVNFKNFDTSNCEFMQWMFSKCSSLISLDLSNFNTTNVTIVKGMFCGCSKLQYLNLKNFELNNSLNYSSIIYHIPENVRVCINETKAPYLYRLISKLENPQFDCSDDWFINNNIFNYSYISLKIKGKGMNTIFDAGKEKKYCTYIIPPDDVLINNIKKNYVHYEYNLEQEENEVKLIWYNHINPLKCLFYRCSNITFVDLSHFNSINVESMASLFD